jgi:hypothetical protein
MPRYEEHEWTKCNRRLSEALAEVQQTVNRVACNYRSTTDDCLKANFITRELFWMAERLALGLERLEERQARDRRLESARNDARIVTEGGAR